MRPFSGTLGTLGRWFPVTRCAPYTLKPGGDYRRSAVQLAEPPSVFFSVLSLAKLLKFFRTDCDGAVREHALAGPAQIPEAGRDGRAAVDAAVSAALATGGGDEQLGELSSLAADVTEMRRELAEAATERQLILGALQALEGKLSEMVPRVEPDEG